MRQVGKIANKPLKHHFLPVFYLKRWALANGKLVEFSKPYKDIVKPQRKHPSGTGYISRLYAIDGVPDELAQAIEQEFLSPVDSQAADALSAMLDSNSFSTNQRLAWSGFLATLLSRMPEDIRTLKATFRDLYAAIIPSFERVYEAQKIERDDRPIKEITQDFLDLSGTRIMEKIKEIMSNERLTKAIAAMEWSILTLDRANNELLTSDRPIVYTNFLGHINSHIALPVSPRRLFIAATNRITIDAIKNFGEDRIVKELNTAVVENANNLVYSTNESQIRFIQNRMGKVKRNSLADRMHIIQKEISPHIATALEEAMALMNIPARSEPKNRV